MSMPNGTHSIKGIFIDDRYFEVPNYQRSYAWKEKQLRDFVDDFSSTVNYKFYYYGTILLQQKENSDNINEIYEIVDGQQRLTTLIIFIYCLIQKMRELDGFSDDAKRLYDKYIKFKTNYVLKLQDQDDGFFKSHILNENQINSAQTPAQEKLLYAKKYFSDLLKNADVSSMNNFLERVQTANCLVYSVEDRSEAAMIFETTNDRGKMLTNLEKTKSFLMYKASTAINNATSILNTIQQGFNDIYNIYERLLNSERFNLDENSIQQYMFIAYEKWQNKAVDGKTIKAYQHYFEELKISINEKVKAIHDAGNENAENDLNNYIETYVEHLKSSFNAIECMFKLGGRFFDLLSINRMASVYPILIKGYIYDTTDSKKRFKELCEWCEVFCFRGLAIMKYSANKFQSQWYELARDFSGDYDTLYDRIKNMVASLGSNEKFIEKLCSKEFYKDYSSSDRNYFFWSYENFLRDSNAYPLLTHNDLWQTDSRKRLTIEHIVAQNDVNDKGRILKSESTIKIDSRDTFDKNYLHSIGNLTIDPLSANSSKGNKAVTKKNSDFFTSAPLMSQNELESFMMKKKWTLESITRRTEKILAFAKEKWCFDLPASITTIDDDLDTGDLV